MTQLPPRTTSTPVDPYEVNAEEFPRHGTDEEKLRFLLQYAVLAPSTHNTQPWLWEVRGNEVALYTDRERQLPAIDPDGRELIMSCGAALEHLRLAMHAFGYADETTILADSTGSDLLARVRLAGRHEPTSHDELLFRAIPQRHTNRGFYEDRALPDELLHALREEAQMEGVWLYFVTGQAERAALADFVAYSDEIQARDKAFRRDKARWIELNESARRDGIPVSALGLSDTASVVAPFLTRVFGPVPRQPDRDWLLAGSAPAIAVLGTQDDSEAAWLAAGQALARVLLRARAAEVWASFFSQPLRVAKLAPWLRHEFRRGGCSEMRDGFPQLIFRLGYAEPVPATPRRPIDDVMTSG